jgi:hypothetical protein
MSAMVLCPACSRHIFAKDAACPFCGAAIAPASVSPAPSLPAELSRAQRYAIGAALAASVATAACSSPTKVHDANDLVVDTNTNASGDLGGGSSGGSKKTLDVATDPNDQNIAADNDELERQRAEKERKRRQLELDRQKQQNGEDERQHWNRQCVNGNCPPYGCVFPDDACDVLRV